jgi:hypothetical protein
MGCYQPRATPQRKRRAAAKSRRTDACRSLRCQSKCCGLEAVRALPGFTNSKPKYHKPDGLFPFVRLKSDSREQYPMAEAFVQEITKFYEQREQEQEARRIQASLSLQRGLRLSNLSLERFRTSGKYQDRPAAADIAFCVAAYGNGMTEDRIERALEDDYLSRDPSPSKRVAHIHRTMANARRWPSDSIGASIRLCILPPAL